MTAARALTLFADGMLIGGVIEAAHIYFLFVINSIKT